MPLPSSSDSDRRRFAAEPLATQSESENPERDGELSFDRSYPDEAIRNLRSSDSATKRAAAAHTLGVVGNPLTTPHLIAALFDPAPEVRRVAAEALEQMRDPNIAIDSLASFLGDDGDGAMPDQAASAQFTDNREGSKRVEGGGWNWAKSQRLGPNNEPERTKAQVLDDREALIQIDDDFRALPPYIASDLFSVEPGRRASALFKLARSGGPEALGVITKCFDDPSEDVRNAAALALCELEPARTAEFFSQAIESASPARCQNIQEAMVASGLAAEAINDLGGKDRERAYHALCILFVMAKTGVLAPLAQAIEEHESVAVRSATMRVLMLSGQPDVAEAAVKRRLKI